MKNAQVDADDNGARLDRWFRRHYPVVSHGQLEKLLRTGQVRLDGKRAKSGDRISTGQIIRLPPQIETAHKPVDALSTRSQPGSPQRSEQARKSAEAIVIKKDSSILVLNKPSGLATQGGSGINGTCGRAARATDVWKATETAACASAGPRHLRRPRGCPNHARRGGAERVASAPRCRKDLLGAHQGRAGPCARAHSLGTRQDAKSAATRRCGKWKRKAKARKAR